jgi:hypothetical protein
MLLHSLSLIGTRHIPKHSSSLLSSVGPLQWGRVSFHCACLTDTLSLYGTTIVPHLR